MKKIFRTLMVSLLLVAATACDDSDEQVVPRYLDVNYVNVAGVWRLAEVNGIAQDENPYLYLVLNRRADEDRDNLHTFESYDNMDSGLSRHSEGIYSIEAAEDELPVVSGYYDHGIGINLWEHDYYVTELTAERMVWTATDNPGDVSVYERCDAVPDDIVAGTRSF